MLICETRSGTRYTIDQEAKTFKRESARNLYSHAGVELADTETYERSYEAMADVHVGIGLRIRQTDGLHVSSTAVTELRFTNQ